MLGFVFQKVVVVIVDQSETGASASSELGLQTENSNGLDIGFVFLSKDISQLVLGNVRDTRMDGIHNLLLQITKKGQLPCSF